jgi:hypothetical protein
MVQVTSEHLESRPWPVKLALRVFWRVKTQPKVFGVLTRRVFIFGGRERQSHHSTDHGSSLDYCQSRNKSEEGVSHHVCGASQTGDSAKEHAWVTLRLGHSTKIHHCQNFQ